MSKYEKQYPSFFKKRLGELTPPVLKLTSPYEQFTGALQLLNHFFWSTELAYAACMAEYHEFEDSEQPVNVILAQVGSHGLKPSTGTKKPHYRAKMGSLLVQLRWNYDALGRYALIEAVSIGENYTHQRLGALLGLKVPSSFEACYKNLRGFGIRLDPLITFRAQMFKLLRNHVVHERSTVHSFPLPQTVAAVRDLSKRAVSWDLSADWQDRLRAASNELLVTTRLAADAYDVPHLFFAGIYCLTRIREYGDDIEAALPPPRHAPTA